MPMLRDPVVQRLIMFLRNVNLPEPSSRRAICSSTKALFGKRLSASSYDRSAPLEVAQNAVAINAPAPSHASPELGLERDRPIRGLLTRHHFCHRINAIEIELLLRATARRAHARAN